MDNETVNELSRASTGGAAAFDDARSFFGGNTSDGGGEGSVTSRSFRGRRRGFGVDDDDDFVGDVGIDDDASLYSDGSLSRSLTRSLTTTSSVDPLDDFLSRYTCDLIPDETVAKLKKRVGAMVFGVNYCPQWGAPLTYTAKPAPGAVAPWWLHKLSYSPGSGAGGRFAGSDLGEDDFDDDFDDGGGSGSERFVEPGRAAGAPSSASGASSVDRVGVAASSVGGGSGLGRRLQQRDLRSALPRPRGVATLTSPKLALLSWLRLQFVADADLSTGRCGLRWRVSTKWSASPGRIGRKERWPVFEGAELRPRWSIDLYTPEVTGTFGAPQGRGGGGRRRGGSFSSSGDWGADDAKAAPASDGGGPSPSPSPRASSPSSAAAAASSPFRRGRLGDRSGGSRRGRAALDLGHCHIRVPRLDAVVDADAAALSLARATRFVAVTPLRVLVGLPLKAARGAVGGVREGRRRRRGGEGVGGGPEAFAAPPAAVVAPPAIPQEAAPPRQTSPALSLPFLPSLPLPQLPFLPKKQPPPPPKSQLPPRYAVRGWPWSLALADGLEGAAARLREAEKGKRGVVA